MGKLQKSENNSPLRLVAEKMVDSIRAWRAEISEKKNLAPNISPFELEKLLKQSEEAGFNPTILVYITLGCEFTFRIRKITEQDIKIFLDEMEAKLNNEINGWLTALQAHLLVKSIEPTARKTLKKLRIPIIVGPYVISDYSGFFLSNMPLGERRPPRTIISPRRGRIPIIGPIIASVWIDSLAKDIRDLGINLCQILLQRVVRPQEFAGWKSKLREFIPELSVQTFQDDWLDKWSVTEMIEHCQNRPMTAFDHRILIGYDFLNKIYSIPWR